MNKLQLQQPVWKRLSIALKALLLLGTLYILYQDVLIDRTVQDLAADFNRLLTARLWWLLLVALALVHLNWFTEAQKWRLLIGKITPVSNNLAIKAVYSGTALSLFTPNRVGGFLGRIMYIPAEYRIKGSILSIFGNIAQLLITLWVGTLSLCWYLNNRVEQYLLLSILAITVLFIVVSILAYVNSSFTIALFKSNSWLWKRYKRHLSVFRQLNRRLLYRVLLISLIRYMVFTSQFALVLYAFGFGEPLFETLLGITLTYFILTVIPSLTLAEFGVREVIALNIIGTQSEHELPILYASIVIWLMNLLIPALVGNIFIVKSNFVHT